ncbi:MAG TPA: TonB-dependent receptor plug domain-containing protein [Longimicrobiales bacterium]
MTRLRLYLAGLLLVLPAVAHPQTIVGRVVEEGSLTPIASAIIEADRNGQVVARTLSDSIGAFILRLDRGGRFALRSSHPSFTAGEPAEVTIGSRETLAVELRMGRTNIPLRPLIVTTERDPRIAAFYERMRRPGSGQFLTRAQIDSRPAARTTDLLREMHGVEILPVSTGIGRPRANIIALRGGRGRCMPTLYIDGIAISQYPESGVDDFLRPEMLDGAEVYTSSASAPPPITARTSCGVVAFWTRPLEDVEAWSWTRLVAGGVALGGLGLLILLTR